MKPHRFQQLICALLKALAIVFEWALLAFFIGGLILIAVCTAQAQCPNDFCETAYDLTLCEPAYFENYNCTDEQLCISPHPGSGGCSYNYEYKSWWVTFTTTTPGIVQLTLSTNYVGNIVGWGNCEGMFQGSQWALAKGSCTNWIVNSINFNSQHLCWCPGSPFPTGPGVWAGDCDVSPCGMAYPLGPYWQSVGLFPQDIDSDPPYQPYVPCKNYHNVYFFLTPDTYYIQVTSVGLSEGPGTIEVCGPFVPLSTPPVLTHNRTELQWTGETTTVFTVEQLEILNNEWQKIGETTAHHWPLTSGGYYRVANQHGYSNPVHVPPIINSDGGVIYNILGQQHAKFGIQSKP